MISNGGESHVMVVVMIKIMKVVVVVMLIVKILKVNRKDMEGDFCRSGH